MCSRFELNQNARIVSARFGLTGPPPFPNKAEVRPTDAALVIGPGRQGRVLHWGLNVSWDKRPLINARAETLAARFKRLTQSRVLVPATSWWEWQGPAKIKMRLNLANGALFAFAGLVDGDRFTLVTCPPVPSIAHVHDRMPLILAPEAEDSWIAPDVPVADALRPYEWEFTAAVDVEAKPQGYLFG